MAKALYELSARNFLFTETDIINLEGFTTIDDLIDAIKNIGNQVYQFLNHGNGKNVESNIIAIKNYINSNYTDQSFSVQKVAGSFNMSLSMLSQYFKANTGQTVIGYLTDLRVKKAKELLISTDVNINDIVKNIGYYSPSSFIKKFKQLTGYTPGQYRKRYRKET